MVKRLTFPFNNWDGGLNNSLETHQIRDNESPDLLNVILDNNSVKKRPGCNGLATPAVGYAVRSLFNYRRTDTSETLIATANTDIYKFDGVNFVSIGTGFTAGKDFCFVTYNDILYLVNGSGATKKYNLATLSDVAGAPVGKYIIQFMNYIFILGDPSAPNRVHWSALANPDSWPINNYLDIVSHDGDIITGVATIGMGANAKLLIFKKNSMWIISDSGNSASPWKLENINPTLGCVSHKTIVQSGSYTYFLGVERKTKNYGIYRYNGMSVVSKPLSMRVRNILQNLNYTKLSNAVATVDGTKYRLGITTGSNTYNDTELLYDFENDYFTLYDGSRPNDYEIYNDKLYVADDTGVVKELNTGVNSCGNATNAYYVTKDITKVADQDRIEYLKKYRTVYLLVEATTGTLDLQYSIDDGSWTTAEQIDMSTSFSTWGNMTWGVDNWGGGENTKFYSYKLNGKGRKIKFKFSNNRVDETFTLFYLVLEYKPSKRPKGVK